jgi:EAL domain-containing protein (putative c-di-GMP-specific phosphodiesterase class I)
MVLSYKNTVTIASSFQEALEKNQIKAAFQTIHSTETGNAIGGELLARWIRDDGSRINPDEFVPVLEKTELIHNLTSFMIDCGLAMAKMKEYRNWFISINFSPTDFSEKCILGLVKKVKDAGVSPSRLHIEITERVLLGVVNIGAHLDFLSRHGFIIVIDDFGTGFSSYRYVADFPIDVIKIDRSLVLKANTPKGFGLVKSIVAFCREFKITTVAEGVENKEYADICEALQIDEQQGYFYSKPEIIAIT